MRKKIWLFLVTMLLCLMVVPVFAQTQVIQTDVTTASDGCVLLGIRGSYIADIQDALDRINEIRLEACQEGVPNPNNPSKKLTTADYVPIKWSSDLEYIARIRAAESCLTINHVRTNGKSCFAIQGLNGKRSYAEVLAWNWTSTMVCGINQWYEEKQDWVDQNSNAVTGHYTSMIDPQNLYVGLGTFCSEDGYFYNTTAGEFSSLSGLDETRGSSISDCIQILEVKKSYLTGTYTISGKSTGEIGDDISLYMTEGVKINSETGYTVSADLVVMDGVTWTSSDTAVAAIAASENGTGILTVKSCGETTITAVDASGNTAVMQFSVEHSVIEDAAKAATCTDTGLSSGSHCKNCEKILKAQTTTPALGHKGNWVTVIEATTTSEGMQQCICKQCHEIIESRTIAKLEETQSTTENQKETGTQSTNTSGTQNTTGNSGTSGTTKATVKLNATSLPMKVKQTTTALKVVSKKTGDSIVSWKSSNTKVVTVSSKGKITAKKKGTATVTVTMKSGAKASCKITVQTGTVKTTKLTVKPKTVTLKKGKSKTLTATRTPLTSGQKLQFKSSNKSVATVSSSGKITAKKKGTATITVTSGSKKVTVKVTVK